MKLDFATMAFSAGIASLVTGILIAFLAAAHRTERGLWWFVLAGIAGAIGLFGFSYMEPPRVFAAGVAVDCVRSDRAICRVIGLVVILYVALFVVPKFVLSAFWAGL